MKTFSEYTFISFSALVEEHGFSVVENITYEYEKFGNGNIKFIKNNITFIIYKERLDDIYGEVSVEIDNREAVCTFRQIVDYCRCIETKYYEINTPSFRKIEDRIRAKTDYCATLIFRYCQPLLEGDISWWLNVVGFVDKNYPKISLFKE